MALTMNVQPLPLDAKLAAKSMYGKQIVNSVFTLDLFTGISVQNTMFGTSRGNLGFWDIKFPKPVFFGDTLRAETEALDKHVSNSCPETGIVGLEHRGYNQHGDVEAGQQRCGRPVPAKPEAGPDQCLS